MSSILLETPEGVTLRQELAGAGSRFGAAVIDLALFALGYGTLALLALALAQVDVTGVSRFFSGVLIGAIPLGFALYQLLFQLATRGRTPGKRAFGLAVVADDGYPARPRALLLRALLLPIDLLTLPLSIGILAMLASTRNQRLGDLVAGTVVVRGAAPWRRSEPFPNESWSTLPERHLNLVPGLAARLDDEDYEFLRELCSRQGLTLAERRRLFVRAAQHYAERLELGRFEDARVVLKELYLFLREARGALPSS